MAIPIHVKVYQNLVAKWLKENPEVGELNGGKYYVYPASGDYRELIAFDELKESEKCPIMRNPIV